MALTDGTAQIKDGWQHAKWVELAFGVGIFCLTIYALTLSIKANKLTIKSLEKP